MACAIVFIHRHGMDLAGRCPSNPPHTRGEPLVNPPEGPCGAGNPRSKERISLGIVYPALKVGITYTLAHVT